MLFSQYLSYFEFRDLSLNFKITLGTTNLNDHEVDKD